jgi:hypothetical protein
MGGAGIHATGGPAPSGTIAEGGAGAVLIGGPGSVTGGAGLRVVSGTNSASVSGNAIEAYGNALSNAGGYWVIPSPSSAPASQLSIPAGQMLQQAYVGSGDMKNIYDGVAILDDSGQVVVQVPDYIAQLNGNFRYQLTPMGSSMPNLYLADELVVNTFRIAGGSPGGKVSWQVTGIRQDSWAISNPIQVQAPIRNAPGSF